jgi:cytochrome c oxidase subunit II
MTFLLILACLILFIVALFQIGKVVELSARIRGEAVAQLDTNKWNGILCLIFLVVFLVGCVGSAFIYDQEMLWYGPHVSASKHGHSLDKLFNITLFFTGIVFVITHILLFWYGYKYQGKPGRKAMFIPHNNRLEVLWTAIPAVVMTILVIAGLDAWNEVMADVKPNEEVIEIEATGFQFGWHLRYPGADGKLGTRDFKKTAATNFLGQDWTDAKNWDDTNPSEIVLPVGKKVRVRITARDVLHNFDLPHFRVKMDAIPGMPTYFVFTPEKTTAEYRRALKESPEYNKPFDPADPTGPKRWEKFDYELACAELCGKGHFSMRRVVRIVSDDEYKKWLTEQKSVYLSQIRGTNDDPLKGKDLGIAGDSTVVKAAPVVTDATATPTAEELKTRGAAFDAAVAKAVAATADADKLIRLNYVNFETNAAKLTANSQFELTEVVEALNQYPEMKLEVGGHTDNVGKPATNQTLSAARAKAVADYLVSKGIPAARLKSVGYGSTKPVADNATPAGQQQNRRTELKVMGTGAARTPQPVSTK